jgi:hypothetical protein
MFHSDHGAAPGPDGDDPDAAYMIRDDLMNWAAASL